MEAIRRNKVSKRHCVSSSACILTLLSTLCFIMSDCLCYRDNTTSNYSIVDEPVVARVDKPHGFLIISFIFLEVSTLFYQFGWLVNTL